MKDFLPKRAGNAPQTASQERTAALKAPQTNQTLSMYSLPGSKETTQTVKHPKTFGRPAQLFEYDLCVKESNELKPKGVLKRYDLAAEDQGFLLETLVDPDIQNAETQTDLLGWAFGLISQSPLAHALFENAQRAGWKVRLQSLTSGGYHLSEKDKVLTLDHDGLSANTIQKSPALRSAFLCVFIKGLREIWQETRLPEGAANYKPEDVLMAERVRAADVDITAVQCAFELRAAGQTEFWRGLLGGEDGDLALVFACQVETNPASLYNGSALSQTFTQWFEDTMRIEGAEHSALELLDGVLAGSDNAASLGDQRLQSKDVEAISELPGGQKYLKGRGTEILKDPAYAGLNDPINQAHLFQIVYDSKVCMAGGVPFRDASLARKLFPEMSSKKH